MKRYFIFILCIAISSALAGCGGSTNGSSSAPAGSAIAASLMGGGSYNGAANATDTWQPDTLHIVVTNSAGQALGDRKVNISFTYSTNPPDSDVPVIQLNGSTSAPISCDTNNLGVCDVPVSFKTRTGLNYAGTIYMDSGAPKTTVTFTVSG